MQIAGIEVIKPNPGVAVGVIVGERVELTYGQSLHVNVTFDYRGPAGSATLYGAIGVRGIVFDEKVKGEASIDLPPSPTEFTPCLASVDIPITSAISPGTNYDLYCKLLEYPGAGMPEVDNVIDVVGLPPVYELIQHTIHPATYVYEGEAEICTIEFPLTPDQLPFTQWGGLKLAETFANAIEGEGNSLLEVKVYEDTTPIFWTNYRIEIKAAVASEEQGIAVWPWLIPIGAKLLALPWGKIILGALTILGIWVIGWVIDKIIKSVDRVIHVPPTLTEEEKLKLPREDLIKMILYEAPKVDYEVSPEDLEEMSDDGLRALLNELIAEAAPPPPPIPPWVLALIGGIGILGIGAAAIALAAKRE